jgi:hypothetical protein
MGRLLKTHTRSETREYQERAIHLELSHSSALNVNSENAYASTTNKMK